MRSQLTTTLAAMAILILTASAAHGTWSNSPDPVGEAGDDWVDTTTTRYVAPGQDITIAVVSLDKDTEDYDPPVADPDAEGQIRKSGGTVDGDWTSPGLTGGTVPVYTTYTVPEDAEAGETIELTFRVHDTRLATDARHDDWKTIKTWTLTVRTDVPTLAIDTVTDTTGAVPVNQTLGKATARMVAGGDPPEGQENWNGTVLTENLGNIDGEKDDLVQDAKWIVGAHPNGGDNVSFTVGTAADNKFDDHLGIVFNFYVLETGVNTTTLTHDHNYDYTQANQYQFASECELKSQAGPKVKGDISMQ
jgi:hypothetical protein